MSTTTEQLLPTLLALPPEDRQVIVHRLLESLDIGPDADDDPTFIAELNRRVEEIKSGKEPGIPAEDVFREMKERSG